MKPMLADDYDSHIVKYPCLLEPKIDGVRALTTEGRLTGRSLKPFKNKYTSQFYSHPAFGYLDGEMTAAAATDSALCRLTTSALNKIEGSPYTIWWLFDFLHPSVINMPYISRHDHLSKKIQSFAQSAVADISSKYDHFRVVPFHWCGNEYELNMYRDEYLHKGYEGTIIRDPYGAHKQGRSTPNEGGLLRIKDFIEAEAICKRLVEGETNNNEAMINELGRTSRSTHQENMTANGMVGMLECELVDDVSYRGEILFRKGMPVSISAGSMPHNERLLYMKQPELIVGKTIKFKTFPKGVKDKPRFATFQSIRMKEDM